MGYSNNQMERNKKQKTNFVEAWFYGVSLSLGAVIAMALLHLKPGSIFAITAGLGASAAISLGWRLLLDGMDMDEALYAGVAALVGTVLPALPFILWRGGFAVLVFAAMLFGAGQLVGKHRGRDPYLVYDVYIGLLVILCAVFLFEWAAGAL